MNYCRVKKYCKILTSIAAIMVAMSFRVMPAQRHLILHFWNSVGDKMLYLDTTNYTNRSGQNYTITNFKYYISNIRVMDMNGKEHESKNSYYLVREDDAVSKDIELADVPAGKYKSISFMIGVDSLHNCSGAQSGALDPINGMFWTWSTGYIFFKLEGKSPASKQPAHIFEYHIGGYKEPTNFIRNVSIDLTDGSIEPPMVGINKTGDPKAELKIMDIYINADIAKVMDSRTSIDISKLSSVTDFHNAGTISDNYQTMFALLHVSYGYE
jgi:hypothetical protein